MLSLKNILVTYAAIIRRMLIKKSLSNNFFQAIIKPLWKEKRAQAPRSISSEVHSEIIFDNVVKEHSLTTPSSRTDSSEFIRRKKKTSFLNFCSTWFVVFSVTFIYLFLNLANNWNYSHLSSPLHYSVILILLSCPYFILYDLISSSSF